VLFVSAFSRDERPRCPAARRDQVRRVYLGGDSAWFEETARRDAVTPYVVYVGNVKPHKNLGTLLTAFAQLAGKIPHHLVVIGQHSGFRTGDSAAMSAAKLLGDRVTFVGLVTDERLRELVAGADALTLPSLYEGFGLPPLEAMACGCPALVSRCGSLPEVCGDAALYCEATSPEDVASRLFDLLTDS